MWWILSTLGQFSISYSSMINNIRRVLLKQAELQLVNLFLTVTKWDTFRNPQIEHEGNSPLSATVFQSRDERKRFWFVIKNTAGHPVIQYLYFTMFHIMSILVPKHTMLYNNGGCHGSHHESSLKVFMEPWVSEHETYHSRDMAEFLYYWDWGAYSTKIVWLRDRIAIVVLWPVGEAEGFW